LEYLEDDLNIPGCLSVIFDLTKEINKKIDKMSLSSKEAKFTLDWIYSIDSVLEILPEKWVEDGKTIIPERIVELAEKRKTAKENKDWDLSDKLRQEISDFGYTINDKQNGDYEFTRLSSGLASSRIDEIPLKDVEDDIKIDQEKSKYK